MSAVQFLGSDLTIIEANGKVRSYAPFRFLGEISEICFNAYRHHRSCNAASEARYRSDSSTFYNIKAFLKFCALEHEKGRRLFLSSAVGVAYDQFARRRSSPSTAKRHVETFCNIAKWAISHGHCADFLLPRPISSREARMSSRGRRTLADMLPVAMHGGRDHVAPNKQLMAELKDFCWRRVDRQLGFLREGLSWRDEARDDPATLLAALLDEGLRREEFVKCFVQYIWLARGGVMPLYLEIRSSKSGRISSCANWELRNALMVGGKHALPITYEELQAYTLPTNHFTAPFIPLFAMELLNPMPICELQVDDLIASPTAANKRVIRWSKYRAHKTLETDPLAIGGVNARTLPRAWLKLAEGTAVLRPMAPPELRMRLFLAYQMRRKGTKRGSVSGVSHVDNMRFLSDAIEKSSEPGFELLRQLKKPLRLSTVRVTALNVRRHEMPLTDVQKAARHQRVSTTKSYLRNSTITSLLEDQLEQAHLQYVRWARGDLVFVPDDPVRIVAQTGISEAEARALINDEFNFGFGISLLNQRLIIVDTAMNCLRLMQRGDQIKTSEDRLQNTNAVRWCEYWIPQLRLIETAIGNFSRRTQKAARELGARYKFSYPECY